MHARQGHRSRQSWPGLEVTTLRNVWNPLYLSQRRSNQVNPLVSDLYRTPSMYRILVRYQGVDLI